MVLKAGDSLIEVSRFDYIFYPFRESESTPVIQIQPTGHREQQGLLK